MFDGDLLKTNLRSALGAAAEIKDASPGCPPNIPQRVTELISDAYTSYANDGLSKLSGATVVSPPVGQSFTSALSVTMLAGLSPGFSAFWSTTAFAAPGLIPANPIDSSAVAAGAAAISSGISAMMLVQPPSMDSAADTIAGILHLATSSLRFLGTPAVGGPPSPIPLA